MTSIITGDIINSRDSAPKQWLSALKTVLNTYGNSPKDWEIYRGDSFQIELKPELALHVAIQLKATLRQFKKTDIRLAIGIGDKSYTSEKITEANGTAFINSGECFEQLKKTTLAIKTPFTPFDTQFNLMLDLALLTMNNWSPVSSLIIKTALEHPKLNQEQLAQLLDKSQSNISEGLKRGGYDEILKLIQFYNSQIQDLW
ncbi:transcriptional regulator [Lacinutrix undariae]